MRDRELKLDFAIIGAMKCGTTSIASYLDQHPEISMHDDKEPNLFSRYPDWKNRLDDYFSHFDHKKRCLGEASTTYTKYPMYGADTPQRLYDHNPNMKLIYIVRDPLKRIISDYMHLYMRGIIRRPIDKALELHPEIIDRSKYHMQISRYTGCFDRSNILVLDYEGYQRDNLKYLNRICQHLGMSPLKDLNYKMVNPSLQNRKYLQQYDKIRSMMPRWMVEVLPASWRSWAYDRMTGPTFSEKPTLSTTSIARLRSILYKEVRLMSDQYGTPLYLDPPHTTID